MQRQQQQFVIPACMKQPDCCVWHMGVKSLQHISYTWLYSHMEYIWLGYLNLCWWGHHTIAGKLFHCFIFLALVLPVTWIFPCAAAEPVLASTARAWDQSNVIRWPALPELLCPFGAWTTSVIAGHCLTVMLVMKTTLSMTLLLQALLGSEGRLPSTLNRPIS